MRSIAIVVFALFLGTPVSLLADDLVLDPLTADTFPGRGGVRGGTFSSSGWTTSLPDDTIWYEIPQALESGTIEFSVTGLDLQVLGARETDLLGVYQAPDGAEEPVPYSPYFRNNDMKVFVRVFGTAVADPGAVKLEAALCLQGPPWFDHTCAPGCSVDQGVRVYPTWTASETYHVVLSWSDSVMTVAVNNDQNSAAITPYQTFAPQPMRVRLGGPRNNESEPGAEMPPGIVFRDFAIRGTPGTRTPACGVSPPPDASISCSAVATLEDGYAVVGDAPDPQELAVESNGNGGMSSVAYLRFAPINGDPARAVLRMHTLATSSSGGSSGMICRVDDDTWSAVSLAWASRPPISTDCVGPERLVGLDEEVEWDVTSIVQHTGRVNLAVVSTASDGVHYHSLESSQQLGPRLCAEGLVPIAPDSGTPEAGVDASLESGPLDAASDATPDAPVGNKGFGSSEDEGGCGCRAAGAGQYGPGALLLCVVLIAVRRRCVFRKPEERRARATRCQDSSTTPLPRGRADRRSTTRRCCRSGSSLQQRSPR